MGNSKRLIRRTLLALLKWIDGKPQPTRELIYTTKAGYNVYGVPVPQLKRSRQVMFQGIVNQMALGIDRDGLIQLTDEAMELARKGNFNGVVKSLSNIQVRATNIATPKLLYQGSLIILFLEGEPDDYSPEWAAKKERILANDSEARFFFMLTLLNTVKGSANISLLEFEEWMGELEASLGAAM